MGEPTGIGNAAERAAIEAQRKRNQAAITLLDQWLAEDSEEDLEIWPRLKAGLDESRNGQRKRFVD